jgi:hypothetical protein
MKTNLNHDYIFLDFPVFFNDRDHQLAISRISQITFHITYPLKGVNLNYE